MIIGAQANHVTQSSSASQDMGCMSSHTRPSSSMGEDKDRRAGTRTRVKALGFCHHFSPTRHRVAFATHRPLPTPNLFVNRHGMMKLSARARALSCACVCACAYAQLRACTREHVHAAARARGHHGSDREEACTPRGASTSGHEGKCCPRELSRDLVAHRPTHARLDHDEHVEHSEMSASATATSLWGDHAAADDATGEGADGLKQGRSRRAT